MSYSQKQRKQYLLDNNFAIYKYFVKDPDIDSLLTDPKKYDENQDENIDYFDDVYFALEAMSGKWLVTGTPEDIVNYIDDRLAKNETNSI